MNKALYFMKKHAPALLTGAAVIFEAGAVVFAGLGTKKADRLKEQERPVSKKDKALIYAKSYWPSALCFTASACSMIFSNKISAKELAAITAICISAEEKFAAYRRTVKKDLGEEKEHEIYIESCKANDKDWGITPQLPCKVDDYDDSYVFYDCHSKRYFVSSLEKVQQGMYHFNRNFVMRGYAFTNEYYEMIGLKPTPEGEEEGWSDTVFLEDYGMTPWVDFYTHLEEFDDGVKYFMISFDVEPTKEAIERVFG